MPQRGHRPSEEKPRHRQCGVDRYTHDDNGISVEKLRRIWKFLVYLSLCEDAMGCQYKLNNHHTHFHSLVHTLAGSNENLRLSIQFQELLYVI